MGKSSAAEERIMLNDAGQLLLQLSEAVLVVDCEQLTVCAANAACESLIGYSVDDLMDLRLDRLLASDAGGRVMPASPDLLLSQPGLHDEVALRRSDGSQLVASLHVARTAHHGRDLAVLLVRDTSARRRLERELITKHLALKEAYEQLAKASSDLAQAKDEVRATKRCLVSLEKMAMVGRFAAGVAHEVNNPMAYIMENLSLLQEYSSHILPALRASLDRPIPAAELHKLEEIIGELQPMLDESMQGTRRVANIVRQLHTFSNITDREAEWADPQQILESSITMVKNQIEHRAQLVRDLDEVPRVACVPGQIEQVLVNLLVNSVHALPDGDPERNRILVRLRSAQDSVVLEVHDTGCGIPPENLQRIMEPFFTTKPPGVGSGLGLAISAHIIEQHGGRFEVESAVGRGTMMRVVLPIRGPLRLAGEADPPGLDQSAPLTAGRRLKLLIVDDEPLLLRALSRNLAKDHEVRLATSGRQALALLASNSEIDFVIADLMMPDMDGIDLYQQLLETHPHLRQRVAVMTGGAFTDRAQKFLAESGLAVLAKPFTTADLARLVSTMPLEADRHPLQC